MPNRTVSKPKVASTPPVAPTSGSDNSNTGAKIDKSGLYDLQQVKRLLDDEVIAYLETQGYDESTTVANIKLIAGTIAVIAAVYSHFGVSEFPGSRQQVLLCVVIYITCSALITAATVILEASANYVGELTPRAKQVNKDGLPSRLWVHTTIGGKGSSSFRVQIRTSVRGKAEASEDSHPYERYFTSEGHFLREVFCVDMGETLYRAAKGGKKKQ